MNNDVVIEILLHLPVRSLFIFRSVCKFWCDVIDSTRFQELHTELHINNNNGNDKADDALYLQFTLPDEIGILKLSTKLLDNGKSLESHDFPSFNMKRYRTDDPNRRLKVAGAIKGLICINTSSEENIPSIVICNPFLDQLKILPLPHRPSCQSCGRTLCYQQVGVGFDEDYKVQAYLYSRRMNSWRKLAFDQELYIHGPIKSLCKNGSFAHWIGWRRDSRFVILSFDMKNEVFLTFKISGHVLKSFYMYLEVLAKDECSFVLFGLYSSLVVMVYESRFEGSELIWTRVMNVEQRVLRDMPLWRSNDFAVFKKRDCVVWWLLDFIKERVFLLYDCRAREFIARLELPETSAIVEYEGSFISP
ncbi:jacalin-related lectin 38-like [Salvia hispanica]|uniref:jacalin-related lectin 38-like n=1 Tax=Salvia hispanica TaxID=49212 RepID=UPI002009512E|nr:jacalin-related lectin 38-like [Salvia hispanica]XP_047953091.1 jacalin-related lectin 38-like [Salvia hispanica]